MWIFLFSRADFTRRRLSLRLAMLLLLLWFALSAAPLRPRVEAQPAAQVPAGDTCTPAIREALDRVSVGCSDVGRNQACYGNQLIGFDLRPNVEPAAVRFTQTGDRADLAAFERITTTPFDEITNTWGIALLKAQVNLPSALPGQNVTFLLFGDTTLNTTSGTMRAFTVQTRVGSVLCQEVPDSALLIQTPENQRVRMNINGADLVLGSTAHITAQPGVDMIISVLEGTGIVTAYGQERVLTPGSEVWMPLGGENGTTVVEPPSEVRPYDLEEMNRLPLELLDRSFPIADPGGTVQPTPIPADSACTPRVDWAFTYRINPGDTLFSIAGRAGIGLDELAAGNCIANPAQIRAGQTIRVPRQVFAAPTATGSAPISTPTATATSISTSPLVAFINANPLTIQQGECATLVWGVNQVGPLSYSNINGLPVPISGNRQECPTQTTEYIFIMAYTDGRASSATARIEVVPRGPVCGDYTCDPGETYTTCPQDCPG